MVLEPDSGSHVKMDFRLAKSQAQLGQCMDCTKKKQQKNLSLSMMFHRDPLKSCFLAKWNNISPT